MRIINFSAKRIKSLGCELIQTNDGFELGIPDKDREFVHAIADILTTNDFTGYEIDEVISNIFEIETIRVIKKIIG